MKILLVYGTTEGQTRKIASFAADRLSSRGHTVVLVDASDPPSALDVGRFDGALIAASLHVGRYQSSVVHFVRQHSAALDAVPNAFISVSLSAASDEPDDTRGLQTCIAEFLDQTGWTPWSVHHVAGAFRYTAYDFLKRWAMKYIAYRNGGPTDTNHKAFTPSRVRVTATYRIPVPAERAVAP